MTRTVPPRARPRARGWPVVCLVAIAACGSVVDAADTGSSSGSGAAPACPVEDPGPSDGCDPPGGRCVYSGDALIHGGCPYERTCHAGAGIATWSTPEIPGEDSACADVGAVCQWQDPDCPSVAWTLQCASAGEREVTSLPDC